MSSRLSSWLQKLGCSRVLCWWQAESGWGGGWNDTQEANHRIWAQVFLAGSRVWNSQNFLCWCCSCLCAYTMVLSDSSSERRLEGWIERTEEFRCDVLPVFVQNPTMQIDDRHGMITTFPLAGDSTQFLSTCLFLLLFLVLFYKSLFLYLQLTFFVARIKSKIFNELTKTLNQYFFFFYFTLLHLWQIKNKI